jgi:hypothetical protein
MLLPTSLRPAIASASLLVVIPIAIRTVLRIVLEAVFLVDIVQTHPINVSSDLSAYCLDQSLNVCETAASVAGRFWSERELLEAADKLNGADVVIVKVEETGFRVLELQHEAENDVRNVYAVLCLELRLDDLVQLGQKLMADAHFAAIKHV